MFHMEHLLDKYIILLSSGELRKFKLASTLFANPRILIMDNPFIGLDAGTRDQLKELLKELSSENALQIILVLSKSDDIPDFITHVVEVKNMKVYPKVKLENYIKNLIILKGNLKESKRDILYLKKIKCHVNKEKKMKRGVMKLSVSILMK